MILLSGVFDGIHVGHVRYIAAACQYRATPGEIMTCVVAPDAYVRRVKGHAPLWSEADRLRAVHGLADVDAARLHGEDGVADVIALLRPRLFVKGIEWEGRMLANVLEACAEAGTEIVYVDSGVRGHTSHALSLVRT